MFKELQPTLYEFFGYALPGCLFVLGAFTLYFDVFPPAGPIELSLPSGAGWWIVVVMVYFAGHAAQACGNLVESVFAPVEQSITGRKSLIQLPEEILTACKRKLKQSIPEIDPNISNRWTYRLCASALPTEKAASQEIYIYREGFYRGVTVSCVFLAFGIFIFLIRSYFGMKLTVFHGQISLTLTPPKLWFFFIFSLVATGLAFRRFRRFGAYRVSQALLSFALAPVEVEAEPSESE